MSRLRYFLLVLLTISPAVMTTAPAVAQPSPGSALAETHCAMCHAVRGTGNSPHPAAPPFRRLDKIVDLDRLEQDLVQGTVLPSHPDMPSFKMDARTARQLINYIRSVQE